ncbi:MAG: hypothetical protein N2652_12265 [Kiritimatiellae bacterium]|nr:hypothetical protein [Kiritimatiellia bacterium]
MATWIRSALRWWVTFAIAVAGSLGTTGCDSDDHTPPAKADEHKEEEETYDLTGLWRLKGQQATYSLRQNGPSLQGRYYDPADPTVHGDIAGVVDGDEVALYVAVTFDTHPQDNFVAKKEGVIRNRDHMTLVVTEGPKYVGKVQEWYRL